jgi:Mg-chelatase subunit ChlD
VTALILVGVGMVTMQEITSDTDDDLAREALLELNSRIEEVTDSAVDTRTTMVFPEGTGTDVKAHPDEGKVNITVTTEDEYWHGSPNPGEFLDANNQKDNATIKLGSIVHEDNDGVETVLQGGGVWRKEDGAITMLSSPSLNLAGDSLQLSFVNLSSINLVQEGEELTIKKNTSSSRRTSDKLQQMVREHMTHDGRVVAEANVTITIESQYAEGWKNYVENMAGVDSSNVTMVDDTTVKIHFGTFGDGIANMPGPDFDDDIIYTGLSDFAPVLYNESEGELKNISNAPGYEVHDPTDPGSVDGYRVGILYDHYDDGRDWWVWNDSANGWQNIENASTPVIGPAEPDTVDAVNTGGVYGFEIADRAWTCAVNVPSGKEFRDYVPNDTYAKNNPNSLYGCLHGPKGIENPEEHGADYEALYEIDEFRTNVVSRDDKSDVYGGPDSGENVVIGDHQVNVSIKVTNRGTKNGRKPLALLVGNHTGSDWGPHDPKIQDGNPNLELNRGETTWYNTTVKPTKSWLQKLDNNKFELGSGTEDDAVDASNRPWYEVVWTSSSGNLTIDDINEVHDGVEEGNGDVVVNATIGNNGTDETTGVARLVVLDGSGDVTELLNYTKIEDLPAGSPTINQTRINLTWHTGQNAATKNDSVYLITDKAQEYIDPDVTETQDNSEFEIEELWNHEDLHGDTVEEGELLQVRANLTNTGSEEATKTIVLKNESDGTILGWNETTIAPGEYTNATFEWNTDIGDDGPHTLEVNTSDDDDTITVTVDESTTATDYKIEEIVANDSVKAGETVEVAVNVTNYGDPGSKNVWLEDLNGEPVDINTSLSLASGESAEFNFTWRTDTEDIDGNLRDFIRVNSSDGQNQTEVDVLDPDPGDSDFDVSIEYTNSSIIAGQNLTVNVTVENDGNDGDTQSIVLENFNGTVVDVVDLTLDADESKQFNLSWRTIVGDSGQGYVNVTSEDDTERVKVQIEEKPNETRDPADVVFVFDETGSMGYPDTDGVRYGQQYSPSGTAVVPDGEVWKTCTNYILIGCFGQTRYWTPGQEVNFDNIEYVEGYRSISGNDPYGKRINATLTAIGALNETLGDRAGLVEFNDYASTYQQVTDDFSKVNDSLQIFPEGVGWTNITAGLLQGEAALDDPSSPNDKYLILLTDGQHTGANDVQKTDPEEVAKDISSDITIYTVGFGDANNETLQNISQDGGAGDGKFYYSSNADNLTEVFRAIVNETTKPDTPQFTVTDVKDTSIEVDEGETVEIRADINNTGDALGERFVTLTDFDDLYVDSWSENLSIHQEETPTFRWDTTGAINWSTQSKDYVNETVTIRTPSDNETVYINITRTDPNIKAGSLDTNATDADDESIEEREVMKVEVTLDNVGDIDAETGVWLYNASGGEFLAGIGGIEVKEGNTKDVTFNWSTEIGDHDIEDVRVETDYDDSLAPETVNITEASQSSSTTFDLNIMSTNASVSQGDSITEGEFLNVTLNVTNTGSETDGTTVMLWDIGNNSLVDIVDVPALDPGEYNESVELAWNTSLGDGGVTDLITVETWDGAHNDTEQVEITEVGTADPNYVVDISSTNADDQNNPLQEGDDLEVTVEIENTGDDPVDGEPIVLTDGNGNIGNITDVSVPSGATQTVTIKWKDVPLIDEINVSSEDTEDQGYDVHIESTATTPDIDINSISPVSPMPFPDNRADAVVAGDEDITVDVEVQNNGGGSEDIFVALYAKINGQKRLVAVEKVTGVTSTATATLTWETTPRQGSDEDNWEIWAEARSGESSKLQVYLDVPEGLNPGGPAFGGGDSGVEIDVGDIEVG